MVIYFKSTKALNYLLKHGFVYTLRGRFRKRYCRWIETKRIFKCPVETVKTTRDSKPLGKAVVYLIGMVNIISEKEKLKKYVKHSGFNSVDEWIDEFIRLNGKHPIAFLYKVKLIEKVNP